VPEQRVLEIHGWLPAAQPDDDPSVEVRVSLEA